MIDQLETLSNERRFEIAMLFEENYDKVQGILEVRKYTYLNSGASYEGQWLGGFRHGHGIMRFNDGATYEGDWYLGHAHGEGKFTLP